MKNADLSPNFKRLLRTVLRAARFGLSGGFSLVSAELASWLVPARFAWITYALVGATMFVVYWWCWGKIFKNVGLVVE
jgi:hypothetical protein